MSATDTRYGRRGGRWLPKPVDVAKLEQWERQRDALADAAARAAAEAEQLDLLEGLDS